MTYLTRAYYAIKRILESQTWKVTLIQFLTSIGLHAQEFVPYPKDAIASTNTTIVTNTSTLEVEPITEFTKEIEFDFTITESGYVRQSYIRYTFESLTSKDVSTFCNTAYADAQNKIYAKYPKLSIPKKTIIFLDNNAPLAIEVMNITGIPTSVCLAQGILESNSGTCEAARKSKVIFNVWATGAKKIAAKALGIPLHTQHDEGEYRQFYGGKTLRQHYTAIYADYMSGKGIFKGSSRYKPCFSFGYGDYKDWAKCVFWKEYATDPTYPNSLIKIIEDYKLYYYDDYYWNNLQVKDRFQIIYTIDATNLLFSAPYNKDAAKKRKKFSGHINKEMNAWYERRSRKKKEKAIESRFSKLKRKLGRKVS